MTDVHTHPGHAPQFAYEAVTDENEITVPATENEEVAEETVDLAAMSDAERLDFFRKLAADNEKLRRETAELKTALSKASASGTTRTKKDAERDARLFLQSITEMVHTMPIQTTEKNTTGFRRYVGSVNVPNKGAEGTTRHHFTVVVKEARRG